MDDRRTQMLKEARARFAEKAQALLAAKQQRRTMVRPPRYDEVFFEGLAQLDEAARSDAWP